MWGGVGWGDLCGGVKLGVRGGGGDSWAAMYVECSEKYVCIWVWEDQHVCSVLCAGLAHGLLLQWL